MPRSTPSLANVRWTRNQQWLFSVSGGVEVDPVKLTDSQALRPASGPELDESRRRAAPPADKLRWWWD